MAQTTASGGCARALAQRRAAAPRPRAGAAGPARRAAGPAHPGRVLRCAAPSSGSAEREGDKAQEPDGRKAPPMPVPPPPASPPLGAPAQNNSLVDGFNSFIGRARGSPLPHPAGQKPKKPSSKPAPTLPPSTVSLPRGQRELTTLELQKDVRVLRAALQVSRSDLKQQNAQLAAVKEDLNAERKKTAQLKEELMERDTQAAELRAQLAESRNFLQKKDRQLEEAYTALSEGAKERGALRTEIAQLEDQLSQSKEELAQWAEDLMDLQAIMEGEEGAGGRAALGEKTSPSGEGATGLAASAGDAQPPAAAAIERGAMNALQEMVELSRTVADEARRDESATIGAGGGLRVESADDAKSVSAWLADEDEAWLNDANLDVDVDGAPSWNSLVELGTGDEFRTVVDPVGAASAVAGSNGSGSGGSAANEDGGNSNGAAGDVKPEEM